MPYFKWEGITLVGMIKKGKNTAYSSDELSARLLQQGIFLLHCKALHVPSFFWAISSLVKSRVFGRIAQLLSAGITLPEVLILSAQQANHPVVCDSLFNYAVDIKNGALFSQATEKQKKWCDSIVITMLLAGYESGTLTNVCESISRYYDMQHAFKKDVRSALAI